MTQTHPLFDKHITILRQAVAAAETRLSWSPYPETPAARSEAAQEAGREAFEAYRDASFYLDQPGVIGRVGAELSPYGLPLNISYPQCSADALIMAAKNGMPAWGDAGADVRTGVCLEILDRLHAHGVEIAHAVMHTTGQPFALAYQHSLAGALVRGLEAVASAYREMKQVPDRTLWEKPQGKRPVLKIEKTYTKYELDDKQPENEGLEWTARELFNKMNEGAKFPMSETKIGRDMRMFTPIEKVRTNTGFHYRCETVKMREFLESKRWWGSFFS